MGHLLFIGDIGIQEVLLIALVVLLFFGGKKIPELMNPNRSLEKTSYHFLMTDLGLRA